MRPCLIESFDFVCNYVFAPICVNFFLTKSVIFRLRCIYYRNTLSNIIYTKTN